MRSTLRIYSTFMKYFERTVFIYSFILIAGVILTGCSGQKLGQDQGQSTEGRVTLQGTGSTFVKPMMDKWASEFGRANPGMRIDYSSTGSGAGIKAIQSRTVDFGATDAAMSDDELRQVSGGEIVHIPVVLGAVVLTYNLDGVTQPLKLTPELISDIFLGKIRVWNDERIRNENPGTELPANPITPIFRADGSGTSDVFTDYLSKTVPEWRQSIGRTKNPQLPQGVGIGGKGNEGVMGQVKSTPNAIGYVELTFAIANDLPAAQIRNRAGNFVAATSQTVSNAAEGMASKMPDDLRFEITNAEGAEAYPIAGIVYVLAYKEQRDLNKGKAIADYLWWCIHDGEQFVRDLHYAPLPPALVTMTEAKINSLVSNGQPVRN